MNTHCEHANGHGNGHLRGHRTAKRSGSARKNEVVCPYCREKDEVIPILYGFPTHESFKKADRGEIYLGGLDISPYNYYCKRDDREF
jgi:hypothetical protein